MSMDKDVIHLTYDSLKPLQHSAHSLLKVLWRAADTEWQFVKTKAAKRRDECHEMSRFDVEGDLPESAVSI